MTAATTTGIFKCMIIKSYSIAKARSLCADQFETVTSPQAFELLKIRPFKYPPRGAKKPFNALQLNAPRPLLEETFSALTTLIIHTLQTLMY